MRLHEVASVVLFAAVGVFAIMDDQGGGRVVTGKSPMTFDTLEQCKEFLAYTDAQVAADPSVVAHGAACVELTVVVKAAAPKPTKPKASATPDGVQGPGNVRYL